MLALLAKSLVVAVFGATAMAPMWAQDTCNLTVQNIGTVHQPNYKFDCAGGCDTAGASCRPASTSGGGTTVWFCECNGIGVTTKCEGRVTLNGGIYTPACVTNNCNQTCNSITFPTNPGPPAWVCQCPDLP